MFCFFLANHLATLQIHSPVAKQYTNFQISFSKEEKTHYKPLIGNDLLVTL